MNVGTENDTPARVAKVKRTGCSYCRHPLFAGAVCKNCGRKAKAPARNGYMNGNIRHLAKWMLITIAVLFGTVAVGAILGAVR